MISKELVEQIIKTENEGIKLDYKEDLVIEQDGDKAEFIKDVVSLANSSNIAHIIVGVKDKTKKLVDIKSHHTAEQLNDILKNRCDPPISLEYDETNIFGYDIGVIEIHGENPPYIISVPDKFGGKRTNGESSFICRGTIHIRNNNKNEGAVREHVEKMYENKIKYVSLQADLQLTHEVMITHFKDYKEVKIDFKLRNVGEVIAANAGIALSFLNVKKIIKCSPQWIDISSVNKLPSISFYSQVPVWSNLICEGVLVQVEKDLQKIDAFIALLASNMRNKLLSYEILLNS
jgi:hypothetical protein